MARMSELEDGNQNQNLTLGTNQPNSRKKEEGYE